jgi:hypothetical protein
MTSPQPLSPGAAIISPARKPPQVILDEEGDDGKSINNSGGGSPNVSPASRLQRLRESHNKLRVSSHKIIVESRKLLLLSCSSGNIDDSSSPTDNTFGTASSFFRESPDGSPASSNTPSNSVVVGFVGITCQVVTMHKNSRARWLPYLDGLLLYCPCPLLYSSWVVNGRSLFRACHEGPTSSFPSADWQHHEPTSEAV